MTRLLSLLTMCVFMAAFAGTPAPAHAKGVPEGFTKLTKELSPAVVNISTAQKVEVSDFVPLYPEGSPLEGFNDFFGGNNGSGRVSKSLGSGFVIDPDGFIVTNNHVIEDADVIEVIFPNGDVYDAELLGRDPATDLALLKIDDEDPFPSVNFGDSDTIEVGEWVMAIGNPFGYGGSVSAGIVSARNRSLEMGAYDDFIQTDVAINQGNSGGPLFNMDGEVIGVNTAIISPTGGSVGISFSIPSDLAGSVVAQLKEYGETRRATIGIRVQEIDRKLAKSLKLDEPKGAIVTRVTEGKPGDEAGMKVGDVILNVGGVDVDNNRELFRIIADTKVGKPVDVTVLRKKKRRVLSVTPDRLKEKVTKDNLKGEERNPDMADLDIMGISIEGLTDATRRTHKIKPEVEGVRVLLVNSRSPAAGKLREGDIIEQVNFEDISTPKAFEDAINSARDNGQTVTFMVNRNGNYIFYSFDSA
ncbi:MAG: Do family serine endopeptidase [Hellea sp.]|nr:Do family serine endopeptidase [Hellea sp.]